jgi:GT2 family glycosyltransferase
MAGSNVSVIIPTRGRPDKLLLSLERIFQCEPAPAEVIVHVDADDDGHAANTVRSRFSDVRLIESSACLGPGGARNRLLQAATCPLVASFDDDSYPLDGDYFVRVEELFVRFPEAAIVAASIFHREEVLVASARHFAWVADFIGCGCVYRRSVFLATSGYVPVPTAYGMEEVDMALRLHADGKKILWTPWLRVFHDTDLKHQSAVVITAASISNLALLGYLRYPPSLWLTCIGQCLSRIVWLLKHGRWRGIISGLVMIPKHLRTYREYRDILPASAIRSFRVLRRSVVGTKAFD